MQRWCVVTIISAVEGAARGGPAASLHVWLLTQHWYCVANTSCTAAFTTCGLVYAQVVLSTHAVGGLTMFDFIMAAKLDALDIEYSPKW
jgi:tetrahydromethanopterin S-methyltransferase subunit D